MDCTEEQLISFRKIDYKERRQKWSRMINNIVRELDTMGAPEISLDTIELYSFCSTMPEKYIKRDIIQNGDAPISKSNSKKGVEENEDLTSAGTRHIGKDALSDSGVSVPAPTVVTLEEIVATANKNYSRKGYKLASKFLRNSHEITCTVEEFLDVVHYMESDGTKLKTLYFAKLEMEDDYMTDTKNYKLVNQLLAEELSIVRKNIDLRVVDLYVKFVLWIFDLKK